ncbi:MAG: aminopeptidase [Spirochaetes bacterium]|uniref:Aminopeptidase n=1 Tax=Candidatus Ornithospirochaeta stercoripullorum TaxID=2840899 RepID=A0A9D9E1Y0_9SPIO|nr:aminopeptidase [Candidatus Ornithospirochaeta stercoripullorum]
MNMLMERYADIIIKRALSLEKGDVLSINTEEANSDFAHLIAKKAAAVTGNGSYIQNIENGRVVSTEEAASDYPIEKSATALLYLPVYKSYGKLPEESLLSAADIQRFRHLSEPLDNPLPSRPFVTAPVPSEEWGRFLDEEGGLRLSSSLIEALLSLGEDSYMEETETEVILYERDRLNEMKISKGRIADEEGTDITFSFLPGSEFATTIVKLENGRKFIPTVYAADIFRALDSSSVNGYFTSTRPFMLFGHIVHSFSARVENGRITDYSTDDLSADLFETYLRQDEKAGYLSELTLAEESNAASQIDFFAIPEWDRMRGIAITLGGPRPDSLVSDDARRAAVDSLVTLSIPIGSDTALVTGLDEDGDEITLMEDGFIKE